MLPSQGVQARSDWRYQPVDAPSVPSVPSVKDKHIAAFVVSWPALVQPETNSHGGARAALPSNPPQPTPPSALRQVATALEATHDDADMELALAQFLAGETRRAAKHFNAHPGTASDALRRAIAAGAVVPEHLVAAKKAGLQPAILDTVARNAVAARDFECLMVVLLAHPRAAVQTWTMPRADGGTCRTSLLHSAVGTGRLAAIEALLQHGANANLLQVDWLSTMPGDPTRTSCLTEAILRCNPDAVDVLLRGGATATVADVNRAMDQKLLGTAATLLGQLVMRRELPPPKATAFLFGMAQHEHMTKLARAFHLISELHSSPRHSARAALWAALRDALSCH